MCQSVGTPSKASQAYWHIGEMKMRLRTCMPRMVMGSNSLTVLAMFQSLCLAEKFFCREIALSNVQL